MGGWDIDPDGTFPDPLSRLFASKCLHILEEVQIVASVSNINLTQIEKIEFGEIPCKPLYNHPLGPPNIGMFGKVGVESTKLGMIPHLCYGVEFRCDILLNRILWFILACE